jgi:hypothetical protein
VLEKRTMMMMRRRRRRIRIDEGRSNRRFEKTA